MRCAFAVAALALAGAQAVLAAPVSDINNVAAIEVAVEATSVDAEPSTTGPPEELVSRLSEAVFDRASYEGPIIVVHPPPVFDPPEPRPGSIFEADAVVVVESAARPPPISLARPETLSRFEGSHVHPAVNPFPADQSEVHQHPMCMHALTALGGLAIVLTAALVLIWTADRVLSAIRRSERTTRDDAGSEPSNLEKGVSRGRSSSSSVVAAEKQ